MTEDQPIRQEDQPPVDEPAPLAPDQVVQGDNVEGDKTVEQPSPAQDSEVDAEGGTTQQDAPAEGGDATAPAPDAPAEEPSAPSEE